MTQPVSSGDGQLRTAAVTTTGHTCLPVWARQTRTEEVSRYRNGRGACTSSVTVGALLPAESVSVNDSE